MGINDIIATQRDLVCEGLEKSLVVHKPKYGHTIIEGTQGVSKEPSLTPKAPGVTQFEKSPNPAITAASLSDMASQILQIRKVGYLFQKP